VGLGSKMARYIVAVPEYPASSVCHCLEWHGSVQAAAKCLRPDGEIVAVRRVWGERRPGYHPKLRDVVCPLTERERMELQ